MTGRRTNDRADCTYYSTRHRAIYSSPRAQDLHRDNNIVKNIGHLLLLDSVITLLKAAPPSLDCDLDENLLNGTINALSASNLTCKSRPDMSRHTRRGDTHKKRWSTVGS